MPFQNKIGNSSNCVCGLVFYLKDLQISSQEDTIPVPLKSVNVSTKIIGFVSEIKVTQRYVNVESNPIEAVYFFPVEEEAAVISFEAKVDDRKISTQIKEKEQARKDYDEAMQNRKTAVLLEETRPDIFKIKVGHLKPNQEAEICITYVTELPVEDGNIKLTIPTTIAPRYISPSDMTEAAKKIASIPYSANTPAPLSFKFTGLAQSKVKSIKSPSHEFKIKIDDNPNEYGQFHYSGELSIKTSDMDRDIILYIQPHNPEKQNTPVAFLEKPDEQNTSHGFVGMVSLVPNFELNEQLTEIIFLVDRSGSMSGSSMNQAKKALELFLHSLPSDCYFNIWSFGSSYDSLFPGGSTKYSDKSLNKALNHVRQMSADYGGTEIYSPLRDIFQQAKTKKGYLRQIFVLTDGEVSNDASIISLVKQNNTQGRIFSLGIGSSASRHLIKGIARAGYGTSVFANQNEDLRAKVMSQLKNALQPAISNISIVWDDNSIIQQSTSKDTIKTNENVFGRIKSLVRQENDKGLKEKNDVLITKQVPSNLPPIFDGTRLLAYYFYPPEANPPSTVSIKADSPCGPLTIDVDIVNTNMLHHCGIVRKLAARKKIQELEESKTVDEYGYDQNETREGIKKTIVQLGLENGLASQYTSFVGIDDTTGDTLSDPSMWTREIKNQIASGYSGMAGSGMPFRQFSYCSASQSMSVPYSGQPMYHQAQCLNFPPISPCTLAMGVEPTNYVYNSVSNYTKLSGTFRSKPATMAGMRFPYSRPQRGKSSLD